MKSLLRLMSFACALAAGAVWSQSDHSTMHHATEAVGDARGGFEAQMEAGMTAMMNRMNAAGYSGNPDVDFLAQMIPHHEGAVEMARLALVYGKDPLTRRLAEEIIASQNSEIAAMKERLAILRRGEDPNPGGFPALHGTRGNQP